MPRLRAGVIYFPRRCRHHDLYGDGQANSPSRCQCIFQKLLKGSNQQEYLQLTGTCLAYAFHHRGGPGESFMAVSLGVCFAAVYRDIGHYLEAAQTARGTHILLGAAVRVYLEYIPFYRHVV